MRNVGGVVDRMMPLIPEGDTLIHDLDKLIKDAAYKAPEQIRDVWAEGSIILYNRFGDTPPVDGWEKQVVDIWMGVA